MADSYPHVWVVEEDASLRETVVRWIGQHTQVQCSLATDSIKEALAALEPDAAPHVVLMDLELSGVGGIEGIRRIKGISPRSHVVVLTTHKDDKHVFEAICAGACGYLLKPTSGKRIIDAISLALTGGAPINPVIARKLLRMFRHHVRPRADYGLTDREQEVLQLLVEEHTQKEIAKKLFVSPHTVDTHLRNIYAKLEVHSRTGAIVKALRDRLL